MIRLKNTKVFTYDLGSLTVGWEYEHPSPDDDLSNSFISILKSESENFSDYSVIVTGLLAETNFEYTDNTLSGLVTRRFNYINYKVKVNNSDGTITYSDSLHLTNPPSLRAKDIIRRKNNILRLHGQSCYLLKKKTFGIINPNYDELLGDVVTSLDNSGHGTPFTGGYYSAISFKAHLTSVPRQNQINLLGEINPGQRVLSITSYPKLAVNDVVVDNINNRWWVTRVAINSLDGYVITQDASLNLIDTNDTIYNIGIN